MATVCFMPLPFVTALYWFASPALMLVEVKKATWHAVAATLSAMLLVSLVGRPPPMPSAW